MLLAEALTERAGLQRKLSDLEKRAVAASVYQEGESPAEDVNALLTEVADTAMFLADLISHINRTNTSTTVTIGTDHAGDIIVSMTEALAQREALVQIRKATVAVADNVSGTRERGYFGRRATRSELKDISDVNVGALRASADELAQEHRELDIVIQKANWNTQLI